MTRTAKAGRIPLRTKILYGAGDIGVALSQTAILSYLLFFYTDVAGLGIGLAGLVAGIARFWDAIIDPPIGYLSDKTRSRFGRRRVWLAIAAVPLGLCVYLIFSPPTGLSQWALFGWMLATYLVALLFFTMFLTPYYALGAELSDDPEERTQIAAIRLMFQYIGSLAGGSMPLLALSYGEPRQGYSTAAAVFGALAAGAILLTFFGTREREAPPAAEASAGNFWSGLRLTVANRPFRILFLSFIVMSIGAGLGTSVSIYALIYWAGFTQAEIGMLFPSILGAAVLALPFWTYCSARVGKDRTLFILFIYLAVVFSALYLLPPVKPLVWAVMVLQGFGVAGFAVSISLLADVLDHDELETGEQRGGAFFGLWTFASKFGLGAGPLLAGAALGLAGYVANQPQTGQVIEVIRLVFGPVPALFFLAAAIIISRFPLSREAHREIQAELHRRRAARLEPGDLATSEQ